MSKTIRNGWWQGWRGQRRHEKGFRLNGVDLCWIGLTIALSGLLAVIMGPHGHLWSLPLIAPTAFFLFCNIFRIRRIYELTWIGLMAVTFILSMLLRIDGNHLLPTLWMASAIWQVILIPTAWARGHLRGIWVRSVPK